VGGSLLALIEGVSFMMGRMMGGGMQPSPEEEMLRQQQEQEATQQQRQLGRAQHARVSRNPAPKPQEATMMDDGDDVMDSRSSMGGIMMSDEPDSQQAATESKGLFSRMLGR